MFHIEFYLSFVASAIIIGEEGQQSSFLVPLKLSETLEFLQDVFEKFWSYFVAPVVR